MTQYISGRMQRGFTIVELLIVIVVIAILDSTRVYRLSRAVAMDVDATVTDSDSSDFDTGSLTLFKPAGNLFYFFRGR